MLIVAMNVYETFLVLQIVAYNWRLLLRFTAIAGNCNIWIVFEFFLNNKIIISFIKSFIIFLIIKQSLILFDKKNNTLLILRPVDSKISKNDDSKALQYFSAAPSALTSYLMSKKFQDLKKYSELEA